MKQSARIPKATSKLSQSIQQRLNMYACAAGASGVGMLALAVPAQAKIIYTPTHRTIKTHHTFHLDLNHDQVGDFLISNTSFCTDICGRTLRVLPSASKNQAVGAKGIGGAFYAYALKRGVKIGPRQPFSGKLMAASGAEYGYVGEWFNVSDRYLGLRFVVNGKLHYGWARLSVIVGGGSITAALTGYAYETIPNKPILAGRKKSSDDIESSAGLPDPSSVAAPGQRSATLGLLAMGWPAFSAWRGSQ